MGVQALTRDFDALGEEAYVPAVEINEAGVFTLQRLDRDAWGLEGGLRFDRRTLETAAAKAEFDNVSASLGAFMRPAEGWFAGVSLSRAGRAPTEAELFAAGPHIATRAFERRFHLADHVQVTGAAHANGMLHIELERQVPEALKPRQIAISSEVKAIEKDVVDAKSVN